MVRRDDAPEPVTRSEWNRDVESRGKLWKRVLRLLVLITLALVVYFTVPVGDKEEGVVVRAVASLIALAILAAGVVWQILLHYAEPERKVDGLLFAVVVAVLGFALAFFRLAIAYPGEMSGLETRIDALYFTMTTILTVGYGDIHAAGQVARVLVMIAMVFNVVVIATAFTTLSSRMRKHAEERAEARRAAAESGDPPPHRLLHRKPR